MNVTVDNLQDFFQVIADKMAAASDTLGAMDAKMGDGDLGLTMKKGYGAMPEVCSQITEADLGKKIGKCAMKMSSIIPSTMGFLMSSGWMTGGKTLVGKKELDGAAYAAFLRGFSEGIVKRGKCAPGDRTILDAIEPARKRAEAVIAGDASASFADVADAAYEGAKEGTEATKTMVPKFGKAAVHAASAEGVADQGAMAAEFLLEAIDDFAKR